MTEQSAGLRSQSKITRPPFNSHGTVPMSSFYIERPMDREYVDALREGLKIVDLGPFHLHGSRQSGKSSLLVRARAKLATEYAVALIDLAETTPGGCADAAEFGQRLAGKIAYELGRDDPDYWDGRSRHKGFTDALAELVRATDRPVILILDELDCLPVAFRQELCLGLRALLDRRRSREPDLRFNCSLVGVEPPLGFFDNAVVREGGVEQVGHRQRWLDDLPRKDDEVATRIQQAFKEFASPPIELPIDVAREILAYGGGYPQAVSWVGNLVHSERERLAFDGSFPQRLRELTRGYLSPSPSVDAEERHRRRSETTWVQVSERFFLEHGRVARESLDIHEQVLAADERSGDQVDYIAGDRHFELLRTSGLARLDNDDRLRLRCPLFSYAFDREWIARVRRELGSQRIFGSNAPRQIAKRILIIGTGGTVGMSEDPQGKVGPPTSRADWLRRVEELVAVVDVDSPFNPPLDSADVGPDQWTTLVKLIVSRQDEFDGIVVAHGTDTMAYTASAVAFALGRDLSFPVVFTGSQTTVDVLHGDALANILRAALVATQDDLPEVVIAFGEKVFRATRTQKKDDLRFDAFESPGYPELGFVAEEVQIFHQSVLAKPKPAPPLSNISAEFSSGILHVSQMPGSEAAFYEAGLRVVDASDEPLCRGIIIQSLGAGNVPTKSPAFDLTGLIWEAKKRLIPVVLTSQYPVLPANYLRYSPVAAAIEAGAIPTGNMTISAVVAKLSWVIPQVDREIKTGMLRREKRLDRVEEMMGREYIGEGGLTKVEELDENESAIGNDDDHRQRRLEPATVGPPGGHLLESASTARA